MLKDFDFGTAVRLMVDGAKMARRAWNNKGNFIAYYKPKIGEFMTIPFLYIDTTHVQTSNPFTRKGRAPWTPAQCDLIANDWYVLDTDEVLPLRQPVELRSVSLGELH